MTEANKFYTRILTKKEIEVVIDGLPALIQGLVGDFILSVEYGSHCNIHDDLQYKPMEVGLSWLDRFLAESIDQRIFVPAESDFSITTPGGGLEILFCHESDIHLSGKDESLLRRATQSGLIGPLIK